MLTRQGAEPRPPYRHTTMEPATFTNNQYKRFGRIMWVSGLTVGFAAGILTGLISHPYQPLVRVAFTIPFWITTWSLIREIRADRKMTEHQSGYRP